LNKSLLAPSPVTVAVEIARHRISAASITGRDRALSVAAHALDGLPPGAVVPSLNETNIADPKMVGTALRRLFEGMAIRPRRVALAIPDGVAKISLLRFEQVPEQAHDLDELIRWQVRKAAPFRIEDAQVSYLRGRRDADGSTEFVVVMARRDIIREYEDVCAAAGAQAGVVDLTTFNVINSVLAGSRAPAGDWLLVHVAQEDATMAILRGEHLVFFRHRSAEGEAGLADLVHQTAMYYEDRLSGSGFSRVVLAGAGGTGADDRHARRDAEYLREALEQRLGAKVDPIDPRQAATLADRISARPDLLDALAPLVGLLARERAA